ncbi:hypothetical protein JCM17961_42310 [Endothiovibrio diazotrophicus]
MGVPQLNLTRPNPGHSDYLGCAAPENPVKIPKFRSRPTTQGPSATGKGRWRLSATSPFPTNYSKQMP